jgi:hypothetical protein
VSTIPLCHTGLVAVDCCVSESDRSSEAFEAALRGHRADVRLLLLDDDGHSIPLMALMGEVPEYSHLVVSHILRLLK